MVSNEGKLLSGDGFNLFWKAWIPDAKPKAVIHIIHGYAEHVDRYKNVVDELVPDSYLVIAKDHRGHGRSDGKRGHVKSFEQYIEDERTFYKEIIERDYNGIPYFVLGHSMGSIIALNYAERYQDDINGMILSGTGSKPGKAIAKAKVLLSKIGSKLFPGVHVKSGLPPEFISRDPDVVKAYVDDPLTYDVITPRLAEQMYTYLDLGFSKAGNINIPVLIQCGSADTSFSGQEELYNAMTSNDKTIKIYEGLKHEVYNELEEDRKLVLKDLHNWLNEHCK
ncbi:MAG: lysophospholipase [Deltaproteobacteria bacterium]|nr:lysophospholipase [Deltaproteobacteria bacterium]